MIAVMGMIIVVGLLLYVLGGKSGEDDKLIAFVSLLLNFIFFFFEWISKI